MKSAKQLDNAAVINKVMKEKRTPVRSSTKSMDYDNESPQATPPGRQTYTDPIRSEGGRK